VLTGESWSEAIARPLVFGTDDINAPSSNSIIVSVFFVVFLLLNSVVLINVVVAVLLEKMVDETPEEDEEGEGEEEGKGEGADGGRTSPPNDGKEHRAEASPSTVMSTEGAMNGVSTRARACTYACLHAAGTTRAYTRSAPGLG